jgi:hypothetical protein
VLLDEIGDGYASIFEFEGTLSCSIDALRMPMSVHQSPAGTLISRSHISLPDSSSNEGYPTFTVSCHYTAGVS